MKCNICGSNWHTDTNCPKNADDCCDDDENFEDFKTNSKKPDANLTNIQNKKEKHYFVTN